MSIIFTHHAEERMRERKMARSDVERVLKHPDKTFPGKKSGTTKFIKEIDDRNHQVVAKMLDGGQNWLVLSVWVRGEDDFNWVEWIVLAPLRFIFWVIQKLFGKKK